VRRSKRNADMADVDSLQKAEKRVAIKNLEETQGETFVNSVCCFSNDHIEKNLEGVAVWVIKKK
jgi:sugar-specific transcriptional regulator TrmB